jgi:hypothetical protein
MAPDFQIKLHKFRDFSKKFFAKVTQLQLRRRKKLFDFFGRFSESSNDALIRQFSPFSLNLIAFWSKIALKQ